MKIVYELNVLARLDAAIEESGRSDKMIDHIDLTEDEALEFFNSLGAPSHSPAFYRGVEIRWSAQE